MYSLGIVTEAFLGIILTLDSWIYSLISSAYKIFMAIASARILSSDAYTAIANKVYVIIGVDVYGFKEILGMWIDNTESATF